MEHYGFEPRSFSQSGDRFSLIQTAGAPEGSLPKRPGESAYETVARAIKEEAENKKVQATETKVREALFIIPHTASAESLTGLGGEFIKGDKSLEHFRKDKVLVVPGVLRNSPTNPKGKAMSEREQRLLGFVQSVTLGDSKGRGQGLTQKGLPQYLEAGRLADLADVNNDGTIEGKEWDALKGTVKINGEDISKEALVRNLVVLVHALEPEFKKLEVVLARIDQEAVKQLRQFEDSLIREKSSLLEGKEKDLPRREKVLLLLERDYETWQKAENKSIVDYLKENFGWSAVLGIVGFFVLQWALGHVARIAYNKIIARNNPAKRKLSPKEKAAQEQVRMREMQEMARQLELTRAQMAEWQQRAQEAAARGGMSPEEVARLTAEIEARLGTRLSTLVEEVVATRPQTVGAPAGAVPGGAGFAERLFQLLESRLGAPPATGSGAASATAAVPPPPPVPVVVPTPVASPVPVVSWDPLINVEAIGEGFEFPDPYGSRSFKMGERVLGTAALTGDFVQGAWSEVGSSPMYERGPLKATKDFARTNFSSEGAWFLTAALGALTGHYLVDTAHWKPHEKDLAHELIGGGELALMFGFLAYLTKMLYQGGGAEGVAFAAGRAAGRLVPGVGAAIGFIDMIDSALESAGMTGPEVRWGARGAAVILAGIALFISAPFALTAGISASGWTWVAETFDTGGLIVRGIDDTFGKPGVEYNKKTGRPVYDGSNVVFRDDYGDDKKFLLTWWSERQSFKTRDHDYNKDTAEGLFIEGHRKVLDEALPKVKDAERSSIRSAWGTVPLRFDAVEGETGQIVKIDASDRGTRIRLRREPTKDPGEPFRYFVKVDDDEYQIPVETTGAVRTRLQDQIKGLDKDLKPREHLKGLLPDLNAELISDRISGRSPEEIAKWFDRRIEAYKKVGPKEAVEKLEKIAKELKTKLEASNQVPGKVAYALRIVAMHGWLSNRKEALVKIKEDVQNLDLLLGELRAKIQREGLLDEISSYFTGTRTSSTPSSSTTGSTGSTTGTTRARTTDRKESTNSGEFNFNSP